MIAQSHATIPMNRVEGASFWTKNLHFQDSISLSVLELRIWTCKFPGQWLYELRIRKVLSVDKFIIKKYI